VDDTFAPGECFRDRLAARVWPQTASSHLLKRETMGPISGSSLVEQGIRRAHQIMRTRFLRLNKEPHTTL
jgi:hypothetical protein